MKKYLSAFIFITLFISCGKSAEYTIAGTVDRKDLNHKYVYMYPYGVKTNEPLDSAFIENDRFVFKGTQPAPMLCMLEFDVYDVPPQRPVAGENNPYTPVFVLESGTLMASLSAIPTVTGTPENDALTAFQHKIKELRRNNNSGQQLMEVVTQFLMDHPDKLAAGKVYCDFFNGLDEKTQFDVFERASDRFKSAPGLAGLADYLSKIADVRIGKKITDFEMAAPDGTVYKLSDYAGKGKIILLDFWASWCGPCLEEIPALRRIYEQYKGGNFEIVGISFDSNYTNWTNAIHTHELSWPHLSDLKGWDNLAGEIYGINFIPRTILIDADGIIIAKDVFGERLEEKLRQTVKNL